LPSIRIHGGEAGGRRLQAPKGVRPSQGLVKEAIFNSLGAVVNGSEVLDLCAGSGALGLEALSRGAARATFVEREEDAFQVIRKNLQTLGWDERGRAVKSEALRWLRDHPDELANVTLVLFDPPYNDPVLDRGLSMLDEKLSDGATVVVEHATRRRLPRWEHLKELRERRYGDTSVTFLERE
jgi:16S rRNA (guanine966-N2)-methyltransferase